MKKIGSILIVLVIISSCAHQKINTVGGGKEPLTAEAPGEVILSQNLLPTFEGVELNDGDTFVFIGNSITHQCLYTQYIENYFYTRCPDKRIHFHNSGVSGDVAEDVLNRFKGDIAEFRPQYASVLIGMNDGQYTAFEHNIFETYKKDMVRIVDSLESIGTIPILITPTMFDLRPALVGGTEFEPDYARNIHYNATLAFFGAWALQVSNDRGLGFVNMYEPLNRITRENRKDNPEFSLIKDTIHPESDGQIVMALAFLRDIGADPVVSTIHIDVQNEDWVIVETQNGKLEKLHGDPIRFRFFSNSLPWVVPEEASSGFKLANAGNLMSKEIVRITGLMPGDYALQIDGKTIGNYSHLQFAGGIKLQEVEQTPQHQQAAAIARLNKERNEEAIAPMRDLWLVRKFIRKFAESSEDFDNEEEKEEIRTYLVKEFGSLDMDNFLEIFRKEIVPLKQKAKVLEDQIYNLNRPVVHTYEIIKQ